MVIEILTRPLWLGPFGVDNEAPGCPRPWQIIISIRRLVHVCTPAISLTLPAGVLFRWNACVE